MSEQLDFERAWLEKFSSCLDETVGEDIRKKVIQGSENLSSDSSRQVVIDWFRGAMERLDSLADEEDRNQIMTGPACQYPKSSLREIRERYEATKDIDIALQMLQAQFESFLTDIMQLDAGMIDEIVRRGWGAAGVRQGDTIIATKIPKSGFLVEYMNETDPQKKRQLYCHYPRIRDVLKSSDTLSPTYCYCCAGFYRGIWEEILGQPVVVELPESVLKGDEACKVAAYLPSDG